MVRHPHRLDRPRGELCRCLVAHVHIVLTKAINQFRPIREAEVQFTFIPKFGINHTVNNETSNLVL